MLEQMCHVKPNPPHWVGSQNVLFTYTFRNRFTGRVPTSLKSPAIAFCCMPDLTVGTMVAQLGNLRGKRWIGSQSHRDQVVVLSHQRQCAYTYHNEQHNGQNNLTWVDLWHQLISHSVSKNGIDNKPTHFFGGGVVKWKPLQLPNKKVNEKQYHIPGAFAELRANIKDLNDAGLVFSTTSPFNSLIWLVQKTGGSQRMMQVIINRSSGDSNCSCCTRCD